MRFPGAGYGLLLSSLLVCAGCADEAKQAAPTVPTAGESAITDGDEADGVGVPACLGASVAGRLGHGLPYATVRVGLGEDAREGAFLLDWGTTRSTIDLAAFPAPGPLARDCNLAFYGERCGFDELSFFGSWGPVTLTTADHAGDGDETNGLRQAGILGTDFFTAAIFSVDFRTGHVFKAPSDSCASTPLATRGFAALSSAGFYANDPRALRPLTDVRAGADPNDRVPNVPTVPLRIASVIAHTQLDTGFADTRVPHSVNVNEAYYQAIVAAEPNALVRAPELDLALTTCVPGLAELVDAYRLAPGTSAELVARVGASRYASDAVLFVKHTPAAARHCGGIGTWDVPAAQIGASFFAGAVAVFDPFAGDVWLR